MYGYSPGLTADLTILDVALIIAAAGIDTDGVDLAAVRTRDVRAGVGRAVSQGKVAVQVELVGIVRVTRILQTVIVACEAHFEA